MSEEIKSVRIRPRQEPPGYKSGAFEGGRLDYKVKLIRLSRRERQCFAMKLSTTGEESSLAWFNLEYKGRRYEDMTDDDIIADYIRTNTLRENPSFRNGNIDMYVETFSGSGVGSTQSVPYYDIIQDPFEKTPPASRVFGRDPYYLNNGAKVYINWFTDKLIPVEGVFYGSTSSASYAIDGFIDDARIGVGGPTPSLSIKPDLLFKRVRVEPPTTELDSSGASSDSRKNVNFKTWVLSEETSDTMATFHPIYIEDSVEYQGNQSSGTNSVSTETGAKKKEKDFFDKSAQGDFSIGQDWMILGDLINAWKNKIPNYDLKLNNPSFLSPSIYDEIKYKDPVSQEQEGEENPPDKTELVENVNLKVYFPPEWGVKVREDCPEFKIFVGDIPKELEPGEGFQFQDDFNDLDELDDEYSESQFSGPEEEFIINLNQIDDEPYGPNPEDGFVDVESTKPGQGPILGSKLTNKDGTQMINLAGHRLKLVIADLEKYLKENGFPGAKIGNNGIMRNLRDSAYPSSPARATASLHGAGLAVDITFSIPGKSWKSIGDNSNLSTDEKLTKTISNWVKTQGDLVWGGQWGKGSNPSVGVVKDRGITEYHHFEIKSTEIPKYWEPVKEELTKLGFKPSELISPGRDSKLHKLMLKLINRVA